MQVGRIEGGAGLQPLPGEHPQLSTAQLDQSILAQRTDRATDRHQRHSEQLSHLGLGEGEPARVSPRNAGGLGAHELLAHDMGEALDAAAQAIARDRLAKDRGVEQSLTPQRSGGARGLDQELLKLLMREAGDPRRIDRHQRVVHDAEEQRLKIRQVAGDVQRDVLPVTAGKRVISGQHSAENENRRIRPVALAHEVGAGRDDRDPGAQARECSLVALRQR